jgi:hypothetical protein
LDLDFWNFFGIGELQASIENGDKLFNHFFFVKEYSQKCKLRASESDNGKVTAAVTAAILIQLQTTAAVWQNNILDKI